MGMGKRFPIRVKSWNWAGVVLSIYLAAFSFGVLMGVDDIESFLLLIALGHIFGDWMISSLLLYSQAFEWRGFNQKVMEDE